MHVHQHIHHIHHHTKQHLHAFHIKHGVSTFTIGLLVILAVQINLFYYLGIMPLQTFGNDIPLSFVGSILPIMENFKDIVLNIF